MSSTAAYRTVQVVAPGKFELAELPVQDPPAGHVRIRVEACGICLSDFATVDAVFPVEFPRVPGHEIVGRIDALGDGTGPGPRRALRRWPPHRHGPDTEKRPQLQRAAGCSGEHRNLAAREGRQRLREHSASKWALEALGEALAFELRPFGIDVVVAEPGPTHSWLLESLENYTLPGGSYGLTSPITPEITSTTEEVAAAIADLVEAPAVPLRAPIGAFTEYVAQARGTAPWDRPFALG